MPPTIYSDLNRRIVSSNASPDLGNAGNSDHLHIYTSSLVWLMSLSWDGSGLSLLSRDGDVRAGVEADVIWAWASLCRCPCCDHWSGPRSSSHLLLVRYPSWTSSSQVGAVAKRVGIIWIHEVFWRFVIGILIVLPLIRLPRVINVWRWEATTINPNATITTEASAECDLPMLRIIIGLRE